MKVAETKKTRYQKFLHKHLTVFSPKVQCKAMHHAIRGMGEGGHSSPAFLGLVITAEFLRKWYLLVETEETKQTTSKGCIEKNADFG